MTTNGTVNQKHVAGVELVENAAELGAIGLRAARRLPVSIRILAVTR